MALESDITLNPSRFALSSARPETLQMNEFIMDKMSDVPSWDGVGPADFRKMRAEGKGVLPPAVVLERGRSMKIPSREPKRTIPCRCMMPETGKAAKAVYMYIYGGGWVLGTETERDPVMAALADAANVAVACFGYRLAPEHPYPAAAENCEDAASWLVSNAKEKFGAEFQFIGGESAGAHLSMTTYLHLTLTRPSFRLSGLLLHYGIFDLSFLPSLHNFKTRGMLVINGEAMTRCRDAFCPNRTLKELRDPLISPFYYDLTKVNDLPPALFTCGTMDCLLDDTVMMSTKWQMAGGKAVVKIWPGVPHGFTLFPAGMCKETREGLDAELAFLGQIMK